MLHLLPIILVHRLPQATAMAGRVECEQTPLSLLRFTHSKIFSTCELPRGADMRSIFDDGEVRHWQRCRVLINHVQKTNLITTIGPQVRHSPRGSAQG